MTIHELTLERIEDWFEFFEKRAFEDHDEWRGCYCTAFYYPKPDEYPNQSNRRKDYARWLVETGRMRGYMAYDGSQVVGWVNANHRALYPRLGGLADDQGKVLSITCFLVDKPHRGQGVARSLLARIVEDAPARGYTVIEAYPKKGARSEYGRWNGPFELYQKAGFSEGEGNKSKVMRKEL